MTILKRKIKILGITIVFLYGLVCIGVYFFQEKLLFFPEKLEANYAFNFKSPFKEVSISTQDNEQLHGLYFPTNHVSKGLIFYLHGNSGSLKYWGETAPLYTSLGYDVFILDYRSFGKSTGIINNQKQLYQDAQTAYNYIKTQYSENKITIIGYSLGTGFAIKLATENTPKQLILKAPYSSIKEIANNNYPFLPSYILKYPLPFYHYMALCDVPISIFHGEKDRLIPFQHGETLYKIAAKNCTLYTLKNQGHNNIHYNKDYIRIIKSILQ